MTGVVAWCSAALASQQADVERPQAARKMAWSGVCTDGQASRGTESYAAACARCHALDGDGTPRRFVGDRFWASWGEDSLASLYSAIRRSMPRDSPGSLPDSTYADIIAFLLQSNGIPGGTDELRAADVDRVWLTRRDSDGAIPDGAFVASAGCLVRDAAGWAIDRGSPPRRSRTADAAQERAWAASEPPGAATYRLLFVVSRLDGMEGRKVLVRGLLVRAPEPAINVTSVLAVGDDCAG